MANLYCANCDGQVICDCADKNAVARLLREIRDRMPVLCLPGCYTAHNHIECGHHETVHNHADGCPVDEVNFDLPVTELRTRPVAREGE